MAQKLYNDTAVQDIADAIREKNGEPATTKYKIAEMGDAIRAIPSGGEKPVITDGYYFFAGGIRTENAEDVIFNLAKNSASYMFSGCNNITQQQILDIINNEDNTFLELNDLSYMFQSCNALVNPDLKGLSIIKPSSGSTNSMFNNCQNLQSFSNFDPRSKNTNNMFRGCTSLTDFLPTYNTQDITTTQSNYMFQNCTSLSNVDLSQFKINTASTSSSTNYMFQNCTSLQSLIWQECKLCTTTSYMFDGCTSLETVDLSGLSTQSGGIYQYMFRGCTNLKTIKLGNQDSTFAIAESRYIFNGCRALESVVINHSGNQAQFTITAANAFTNVPTTCKFYVPDAAVDAYKAATNWSSRASQIFPLSEYVES